MSLAISAHFIQEPDAEIIGQLWPCAPDSLVFLEYGTISIGSDLSLYLSWDQIDKLRSVTDELLKCRPDPAAEEAARQAEAVAMGAPF